MSMSPNLWSRRAGYGAYSLVAEELWLLFAGVFADFGGDVDEDDDEQDR